MKKIFIGNQNRPGVQLSAGDGEPTRIVASIGLSPGFTDVETEFQKARIAVDVGADIVNDDSIVEPEATELRNLLTTLSVPVNTEPIFSTSAMAFHDTGNALNFTLNDVLTTVEEHAKQGIDILTLHCAHSRNLVEAMANSARIIPMTSRGGAILTSYMIKTGEENPYRAAFEEICEILHEHNVTLSLGTTLRPATICDGFDQLCLAELSEQVRLVQQAWKRGLQVMVEGAGHIAIDQIEYYVKILKKTLRGAPIRLLGPTTCDCGTGYDHITGCIGGAVAAMYGCDFLTCTTRAEHIGLPRIQDLREAVIAFRIAAYVGNRARNGTITRDRIVSEARRIGDWQTVWKESLYGSDAQQLHRELNPRPSGVCSICGPYCALRYTEANLRKLITKKQESSQESGE